MLLTIRAIARTLALRIQDEKEESYKPEDIEVPSSKEGL